MYIYLGDVDFCVKVYFDGRNFMDVVDKCWLDGGYFIMLDIVEKLYVFLEFVIKYSMLIEFNFVKIGFYLLFFIFNLILYG